MTRNSTFELNTPDMSINSTPFYPRETNFAKDVSTNADMFANGTGSPNFVTGVSLPEFIQNFVSGSPLLPRDSLRTMLSTLDKTQLIEMLSQAILSSPEVQSTVAYNISSLATFRRLLVRNIAFSSTSEEVKQVLGDRYGAIEEGTVVYDRSTGRSKGFAFVTFASIDSACAAIIDSNNGLLDLNGRPLFLKYAADKVDSSAPVVPVVRAEPAADFDAKCMRKLFVYNLDGNTTSESLADVFAQYGPMEDCLVVQDGCGVSKRYGFVTFVSDDSAWSALQDPNKTIDGRMTFTHLASEGPKSGARSANSTPVRPIYSTPVLASSSEEVDLLFNNIISGLMERDEWNDSCSTPENIRNLL